uniref:SF3 helicase domain-containing protein n=1 Tax=uncultured Bacillota bacterium TaxID=344338 RepID=A0A650EN64_9FIRM|nr:hypothetical protein Firmicute1046_1420 [uncultured Firmicutes bacterium]
MQKIHLVNINENIFVYNNFYYKRVSTEELKRIIAKECREDYEEAGNARYLNNVIEALIAEEKLVITEKDVPCHIISFENGILDLKTRQLLPHSPRYIITYGIQCSYMDGQCPNFEQFIYTAMGGNAGLIERALQMIGYILSPDMNGKVFFVLQGCPHSGKSLLSELLRLFFNKEAAISLDVHELIERFSVSNLEGKTLWISPDLPSTSLDAKAVSKLKQLTGNDYISADVKYQNRKEFFCHAKFVLSTNHPFVTRQPDEAFMERIVAIPFLYSVPKEYQDHNLLEKMKAEMGAIAFKAIQAYCRLVGNKYQFAGNYQLNSAPVLYQQGSENMTDLSTATYSFMMSCFEEDKQGIVFIEDAHKAFMQQYCITVADTIFSRHFTDAAQQTFHVSKGRKRKSSGQNAQSCILGIRFKQE